MNFPITWSPSIQSYYLHQAPTTINPCASSFQAQSPYLEALFLQQQNNKKMQTMFLQQKLLAQLSQTCSQIPLSPQAYVLPEKLGQSLYFNQVSPKAYQVQCEQQQVNPIYIMGNKLEKITSPFDHFKSQISQMLDLFVNLCGSEDEHKITSYRAQYSSDQALLSIFDSLLNKYRSCAKNREDMVRFVLRKAMSSLRDSVRGKCGLSAKGASLQLCRKYFSSRLQELTDNNIDLEDEDQVLNFLLPYKKNSRNKTANGTFITEIFASEAFYEDYLQFLEKIDDILEVDNKKRSKKLVDFLAVCAEEGNFARIKGFKRMPWLKSWLNNVKEIAHELLNTSKKSEDRKKLFKYIN